MKLIHGPNLSPQSVLGTALLAVAVLAVSGTIGATYRVADSSSAIAEFAALRSDAWELALAASSPAATSSDIDTIVARAESRAAVVGGIIRNVAPEDSAASLAQLQGDWASFVDVVRARHDGSVDSPLEASAARVSSSVDSLVSMATTANVQAMRVVAFGLRTGIVAFALAACLSAWVAARRFRFSLANVDPTTGLPTIRHSHRAIERLLRKDVPVALLAVRVNDLDTVEDALGSEVRARLLREVASRLIVAGVAEGELGVVSNNTLIVMIAGLGRMRALARSELILESLAQPLMLGDIGFPITLSKGIASAPDDGATPSQLTNAAIRAASRAPTGPQGVVVFRRDLDGVATLDLDRALQQAVDAREFELQYQPIIDLRSGLPAGAEALLSWPAADERWRSPDVFVRELERVGLMGRVTRHVLARASIDAETWSSTGGSDRPILAVNLSPQDLFDPEIARAVGTAQRAATSNGIRLEVEISERTALDPGGDVIRAITRLRATGVRVALDDFGVEQTTLSHVQQLRPDTVKIDRSLIAQIQTDVAARELVRSTIDAVHSIGSVVVAEGVEFELQVHALRAMNCDFAQGYYFGRKMSLHDFNALVAPWAIQVAPSGRPLVA